MLELIVLTLFNLYWVCSVKTWKMILLIGALACSLSGHKADSGSARKNLSQVHITNKNRESQISVEIRMAKIGESHTCTYAAGTRHQAHDQPHFHSHDLWRAKSMLYKSVLRGWQTKTIAYFFGAIICRFAEKEERRGQKYIFWQCMEHACACKCMSVQAVIVILMDEHFDLLIVSIWKRGKKYISTFIDCHVRSYK